MKKNKFASNESDLFQSVINYNNSPEFIRSSLGGYPKYFLHITKDGKHYFGLSKFCAFDGITLLDYIDGLRHTTNGGTTQKHISKICNKTWMPYVNLEPSLRKEFDSWIKEYFPNYNKALANFITVKANQKALPQSKSSKINAALLKLIGDTGEKIALKYESDRIGIKGEIEHVALKNDNAGFDIYSKNGKEERFIEVKASIDRITEFYITTNEIETLKRLKDSAYLYLVTIVDLYQEIGSVVEIKNPWKNLLEKGNMKPTAFRFKF